MIPRFAAPAPLSARASFDSGGFSADPLTIGVIAVSSVLAAAYTVQAALSGVNLVRAPGHRGPYAVLCAAAVFECLSYVINIALNVITNWPDRAPTLIKAISLQAAASFFDFWFIALIFLSVVLFILDRQRALQAETRGREARKDLIAKLIHATLFVMVFVLGTAASGLNTALQLEIANGITNTEQVVSFLKRSNQYTNLVYAFDAFWYLTAFDIVISAFLLHKAIRRAGASDKITNLLLYAVGPLYSLRIITSLIFTIIESPSGPLLTFFELERVGLANTILSGVFWVSVISVLLAAGGRRANWSVQLYRRFEMSPSQRTGRGFDRQVYGAQKPSDMYE